MTACETAAKLTHAVCVTAIDMAMLRWRKAQQMMTVQEKKRQMGILAPTSAL